MNRQMIAIETEKSGTFLMPIGSFYIHDFVLCNVFTGATLGVVSRDCLVKLSKVIDIQAENL